MDSLLKWAILNSATANEDAPARDPSQPAPKQQKLDPEIIDMILGKPASVQMTECLDATEHTSTPLPARIIALDDLEMLVENIDNAGNLGPLQLWPRITKLYNDPEAEVRSHALWVSGTAVQHNPSAQKVFPGLAAALELLRADSDMGVRAKALYCVSSFVRANVAGLTKFVALNGLEAVLGAVQVGDVALAQKGFFLLRALIDEAMDEETPEELRPGKMLVDAVLELGAVEVAARAVAQWESLAVLSQALGFVRALAEATLAAREAVAGSAELRSALEEARQRNSAGDEEREEIDAILELIR